MSLYVRQLLVCEVAASPLVSLLDYCYRVYSTHLSIHTLLEMGSYSSTVMCQYWDNHLFY